MASHCLIYAVLCLLLRDVQSSTLYQWVVDSQTRFNYDPDINNGLGVYNWPRTYPESCSGERQSPVDIDTTRVRYGVPCTCPRMVYRSPVIAGELKNNGLSATFEPESPMALQIMDAPQRPGTYYLNDFHLHFGGVTGRSFELQGMRFRGSGVMSAGSEHTIDGLRFEGEIHFVFYNSRYRDLEEAESKPDGVVVITLLVQKQPGTMVDNGEASEFSRFLEGNIPRIFPYQRNVSMEVDLRMFFNRRCDFYTYQGSITTPTCHESVRWVIMRDPIMVTERAWFRLTGLQSRGDFNSRFGNYRTTQPLNDRVIEANFMPTAGQGPVRPMPNGEPIRGPAMFMGMANQLDVPMPPGGNRSPMLNGNPNFMSAMPPGGNRSPMLNGNPNLMSAMPPGGNRSPMLNGNPNLMLAMPPGRNRSPMLNGNPNLMPAMPMVMPTMVTEGNRSQMFGGNPNLMPPMSVGGNRSPIPLSNPVQVSQRRIRIPSSGQVFMPAFNRNFLANSNNNNNDDENNNRNSNSVPLLSNRLSTGPMGVSGERRMNSPMVSPVVRRNQLNSNMPPTPPQNTMKAIQPDVLTLSSLSRKAEIQGAPGPISEMASHKPSKHGGMQLGASLGIPAGGGRMKERGQVMLMMVPAHMLEMWKRRQAYMAGLN